MDGLLFMPAQLGGWSILAIRCLTTKGVTGPEPPLQIMRFGITYAVWPDGRHTLNLPPPHGGEGDLGMLAGN